MRHISGALLVVAAVALVVCPAAAQDTRPTVKLTARETKLGALLEGDATRGYAISEDSKHVAVLTRKETKDAAGATVTRFLVTLDGTPGKEYEWIVEKSLAFSADGTKVAFVVQQQDKMFAVIGGQDGQPYHEILNSQIFASSAGARFAYYAKAAAGSKTRLVIDGQESKEYDQIGNLSFSPDGKHVAYGVQSGSKQCFVVDGTPEREFDNVAGVSFAWSPDSQRHGYAAKRQDKLLAIIDGKDQVEGTAIGRIVFSPDSQHLAYPLGSKDKMHIVQDGKDLKEYDRIVGDPQFSPDSKRLAYAAARIEKTGDQQQVRQFFVVDGEDQRPYDQLAAFLFSPDSKRTAFVAGKTMLAGRTPVTMLVAVIDGIQGPEYEEVRLAQFSPDSKKMAYLARRNNQVFAVVDNSESAPYGSVSNLLFSKDGRHMAFAAINAQGKSACIVRDGREGPQYNGILPESLVFSPDGEHVAFEGKKDGPPFIAVDDAQTAPTDGTIRGSHIVWDSPTALHALILRSKEIFRMDIDIAGK